MREYRVRFGVDVLVQAVSKADAEQRVAMWTEALITSPSALAAHRNYGVQARFVAAEAFEEITPEKADREPAREQGAQVPPDLLVEPFEEIVSDHEM